MRYFDARGPFFQRNKRNGILWTMAYSVEKIGIFSWEDPFLFTEQLNEEERLISETARAFAREHARACTL